MTPRMKEILNKFNDVIVINTTHKSNRFNVALLDIIVVNNFGKSVTCYFSLLKNQKCETFQWALNNFKEQLVSDLKIIFSDEDEALTKVNFIIFVFYILAIKTVFPQSINNLCAWHVQQNLKKKFCYLNRSKKEDQKTL